MLKDKIKKLREEKRLTQKQLADKINVGQSTIAMIESGKNVGSNKTIIKLADFFNVPIDYLLSNEDKLNIAVDLLDDIHKIGQESLANTNSEFEVNYDNSIYRIASKFSKENFTRDELEEMTNYIKYILYKRNKGED